MDAYPRSYEGSFVEALQFTDVGLNVILVNTAVSSTGGLFEKDDGRLFVSEKELDDAIESVSHPTYKTLVLGHHPIHLLAEQSKSRVETLLEKVGAVYLNGHMHQARASTTSSNVGKIFCSQNSAIFLNRANWNGFSTLSLVPSDNQLMVQYHTYTDAKRTFVTGTDVIPSGTFYLTQDGPEYWRSHPSRVDQKALGDMGRQGSRSILGCRV